MVTTFNAVLCALAVFLTLASTPLSGEPKAKVPPAASDNVAATAASGDCENAPQVQRYARALEGHLCSTSRRNNCLTPVSLSAEERGQLLKYVHGMKLSAEPVHLTMEYFRELRNAAYVCPAYEPSYLGASLHDHLRDQIDYINDTLPVRYGIPAFENEYGFTHGMEQLEYAAYLLSLANNELAIDPPRAEALIDFSLEMTRSLDYPVGYHTGGVLGPTYDCGPSFSDQRPCYFYSARGLTVPGIDRPHFVLNQNLHVIRDTLGIVVSLLLGRDEYEELRDVDPDIDRLMDRVVGGLYQLAYSPLPDASAPDRIPGLAGFLNRQTRGMASGKNTMTYYWAFYEYDPEKGRASNISHRATCGYHGHVLKVFSDIYLSAHKHRDLLLQHVEGRHILSALRSLSEHGNSEEIGDDDFPSPLYQLWLSASLPGVYERGQGCSSFTLAPATVRFYRSLYQSN